MNYKINGYYLDEEQMQIVLDDSKCLLVVAGAGSGKTLTILGKIGYLLKKKNIKPEELLCISFTKKASSSLEEKIKNEFNVTIPVYTFHKLALEILKNKYSIADSNTLENIIHLFFYETIYNYPIQMDYVLRYFNMYKGKNTLSFYKKYIYDKKEEVSLLEKNISMFIHLFKCNGFIVDDFHSFFKKIRYTFSLNKYLKEKYFLLLALNIYLIYIQYLKENNEIDFDDMIINATSFLKKESYKQKYKYIIIDEYQDTSLIRFNLIKEILMKTNANLLAVGDDFQSIYRFTGCDINLFLNFRSYFNDAKIMKIENTYRNSQELIKVAGDFVMKNPKQIRKKLKSNKNLDKPIRIVYYNNIKIKFKELVEKIYIETYTPILILGRNNNDINLVLDSDFKIDSDGSISYLKNKDIKLKYLTIHKSKGLEEENVIIINLSNNKLGLPSKIENEKVLRLVSPNIEKYLYSEERRLFYVALTRTKNYVYLLAPKNCSIFVKELMNKKFKKYVKNWTF